MQNISLIKNRKPNYDKLGSAKERRQDQGRRNYLQVIVVVIKRSHSSRVLLEVVVVL